MFATQAQRSLCQLKGKYPRMCHLKIPSIREKVAILHLAGHFEGDCAGKDDNIQAKPHGRSKPRTGSAVGTDPAQFANLRANTVGWGPHAHQQRKVRTHGHSA